MSADHGCWIDVERTGLKEKNKREGGGGASVGGEEGGGGATMAGPPKLAGEERQVAVELHFPNRIAYEKEESEVCPFPTQTRPG